MKSHSESSSRHSAVDVFGRRDLISQMSDAFGWPDSQDYVPVARWKSPKAQFFRFVGKPGGREIVVKAGTNWGPGDPRFVYEELNRLQGLLAGLDVAVPAPLGWLDDPPIVAMEAVKGDKLLSQVIPDRTHHAWRQGLPGLLDLVGRCGRVLAAYHGAQPAPPDPQVAAAVRLDLRRAARRGLVSPRLAQSRAEELAVARGFRFSANDFLVAGERLIVVDPPHVIKYDVVQRDLSAFTFEVYRALRIRSSGGDDARLADAIRAAFVAAYLQASPAGDDGMGRWALEFYELSRIGGMVYNQVRSRQFGSVPPSVAWAIGRRSKLGLRGGRIPPVTVAE